MRGFTALVVHMRQYSLKNCCSHLFSLQWNKPLLEATPSKLKVLRLFVIHDQCHYLPAGYPVNPRVTTCLCECSTTPFPPVVHGLVPVVMCRRVSGFSGPFLLVVNLKMQTKIFEIYISQSLVLIQPF